jgi:hypothetical protein
MSERLGPDMVNFLATGEVQVGHALVRKTLRSSEAIKAEIEVLPDFGKRTSGNSITVFTLWNDSGVEITHKDGRAYDIGDIDSLKLVVAALENLNQQSSKK